MNQPVSAYAMMAILLSTPLCGWASDLTRQSLQGKWIFTHILMDGSRQMEVNNLTEFSPNGVAIFYDSVGTERSRGSYEVAPNSIIYTDSKGKQVWKLISFEGGRLHVDHRGAEMFFERQ